MGSITSNYQIQTYRGGKGMTVSGISGNYEAEYKPRLLEHPEAGKGGRSEVDPEAAMVDGAQCD
jgi:hypothetical protein